MKHERGTTNNRMDIFMTRVIYPVGFGTFCIERFYQKDTNVVLFDMMYDCGSKSHMLGAIMYEAELLYKQKPLDLVCISHFDEDHINGFRKLIQTPTIQPGITTILLPQIFEEDHILELSGVEEFVNYSNLRTELAERNLKVIEVLPIGEELNNQEREAIDIRELKDSIESGTKISIIDHLWEYIPFNNFDRQRNIQLLDKLMALTNFDAQKIVDIHNGNISPDDIKKLKGAYQKLGRRKNNVTFINQNSLQVLSKENVYCSAHLHYSLGWIPSYMWVINPLVQYPFDPNTFAKESASCMYTGDSIMDQRMVEIQDKYAWGKHIGLFQIPHHGSTYCYDQGIMNQLNIGAAFVNTTKGCVHLAPGILKWNQNNISALFMVFVGNGGIYEYIY